jgi:hypothetical protein
MMRANRNKARLVKHTLVRLWGKRLGENWFYGTRWAAYDSYANLDQNIRDQTYADMLKGNVYVRAEAERRLALGWNVDNSVQDVIEKINLNPHMFQVVHEEVSARLQRNDPVYEEEVLNVMHQICRA